MLMIVFSSSIFAAQMNLPTTLDKLIATGDFVMVGDLKFDAFDYPADSIVLGDMPFASQIAVQESPGGDGLRFTGPFLDLPGGAGNGASDATLGFDVSVVGGGAIASATMHGNPSLKGNAQGIAEVVETFEGIGDVKLLIYDKSANNLSLTSTAEFSAPVTELSVVKDILLLSQSDTNAATISVIDQEFTLVPEPATFASMLIGLLGFGLLRCRRTN